jgi:hypothetical protein
MFTPTLPHVDVKSSLNTIVFDAAIRTVSDHAFVIVDEKYGLHPV